jgi:transcriptional regulator GlxA family with amidase domain
MRRIAYVVTPGFQVMVFAGLTAFELANATEAGPAYELHLVSEKGGLIKSSLGVSVSTEPFDETIFDTVIVSGSLGVGPASAGTSEYLRRSATSARRIASTCTGAFALAEAGLLNARRATTHWAYARSMQNEYPQVLIDEDRIFITDGSVWTSAGMTAGIDLALGMIEEDLGPDAAKLVAKRLVVYQRRAGGQLQHSALLEIDAKSDRIQSVLSYAKENLSTPLSVEQLADVANLSPRQFSRAFRAETGQSPAKAIENLRVEAARLMMENGRHPIDTVANETGFADRERMRRAFIRAYGQPPQTIRRNARFEM